jgi:hypothetical protein
MTRARRPVAGSPTARAGELAVVVKQVALRDIEHAWERQRSAVDRKLVVSF